MDDLRAPLPGLQRFDLSHIPPEPWRNGGGWTRTVASQHVGTRLRWRISAADITQPGAFSVFEGIDRTAVLMRGAGLALQGPQERWVFEGVGAVARFPGETPLQASPGPDGTARLWNVMVDRATVQAHVAVHRDDGGRVECLASGVLVVLAGRLQVRTPDGPLFTLGVDDGLWLNDVSQPLTLQAESGCAQWVMTTFALR